MVPSSRDADNNTALAINWVKGWPVAMYIKLLTATVIQLV